MATQIAPRNRQQRPLARLREEFESLFERFFGRGSQMSETETELDRSGVSHLDFGGLEIDDRDDEIVVQAALPGFEPGELDVQLSGRLLTIKAEKKEERKKSGNGHTEEFSYRTVARSFTVPEGLRTDEVEAKYHNGVLEIHLPKREEAKAKRIAVQL